MDDTIISSEGREEDNSGMDDTINSSLLVIRDALIKLTDKWPISRKYGGRHSFTINKDDDLEITLRIEDNFARFTVKDIMETPMSAAQLVEKLCDEIEKLSA
jgi:hypothetical protein